MGTRGGARKPGPGKRIGRPKNETEADPVFGKGFAGRVFKRFGELKLDHVRTPEDYALGILAKNDQHAHAFFNNLLDRHFGKAVQPTIQKDTRENVPELEFGNLVMPAAGEPGKAGKPN